MTLGHNSADHAFTVTVRLFNSVRRHANGGAGEFDLEVRAGETVRDIAARLAIPLDDIFLVLVNGRDITPGLVGAPVTAARALEAGDVVAFSGAVPYSYGYGAPVV